MIVLMNDKNTEISRISENEKDELWIREDELKSATGFELKPHGACLDEICIPMLGDEKDKLLKQKHGKQWVNMSCLSAKLDQKLVYDQSEDIWSLGSIPDQRRSTLESGIAPDFEFDDWQGNTIRLSDYRGKKVLIITWASW